MREEKEEREGKQEEEIHAMKNSAAAASCGSNAVGTAADSSRKRLFNLLEAKSKERILRLVMAFRNSTPLEQEAFAQEIGVSLPREEPQQQGFGPLTRQSLSGPALAVRLRDRSYVALADRLPQSNSAAGVVALISPFLTATSVSASFEEHAEDTAASHAESHNQSRASAPIAGSEDQNKVSLTSKGAITNADKETYEEWKEADSKANPVLFRSRAYQALRLARGEENAPVTEAYTKSSVFNVTGIPIDEADLWEWFDILDVTRSGTIGVASFLETIKQLDRGFGVSQKAEEQWVRDAEALATDGQLTFEKFAFLVSRLAAQ
ncbi:hypothetical protein MOQ_003087 [Trypanosoma cruzi marinkellei]|uniref:EF-hand domain-containing protein n=1 Tax=Trypanosoma cruzi marinkellei TaxID=85056 RepID=K2NDQ4_TRYCR|nr:hypothetical protein MOQ_003087 [Trypanosoma cruzi marinkellei]